jgi:predicted nucleic acid-binding protein
VILVDTSVWIELLNGKLGARISEEQLLNFATCGPVAQEVLQGLRNNPAAGAFREMFLSLPCLNDPLPLNTFLSASEIYRLGRIKGHTIRSSTDCLIAAIAIENGVPIWHKDRDYEAIAKFTALRTIHVGR